MLIAVSEAAIGSEGVRAVLAAAHALGVEAEVELWDRIRAPARPVVVRHTWDYHLRLDRFRRWLDELEEAGADVPNPRASSRWNLEKGYLEELASRGVAVPRTIWLSRDEQCPGPAELRERLGGERAVIKPSISATSWRTELLDVDDHARVEAAVRSASETCRAMVQEYVPEIERGEWSLMYLGGAFSHAVFKSPVPGEFRVQSDFGGAVDPRRPPDTVREASARVLSLLDPLPTVARVDGVETERGFVVMEVELIEPELFLSTYPPAAERLVRLVVERAR